MKVIPLLLICLAAYCLPFLISDQLTSREDLIFNYFSGHLAETGSLGYRSPGDASFARRGFVPRCFIYRPGRDETLPPAYPGFILLWAGVKKLLPPQLARLINPGGAVLALFLLYLIARVQFGAKREALQAMVILATTPVFIYYTYLYRPILGNLIFFLAGLYFLLLALRKGRVLDYLLFGLAAGFFLWIQPGNPVYLAGLFIFFLIERGRVRLKLFLISVVMIVVLGGGLLVFNRIFYGSFLPPAVPATYAGLRPDSPVCHRLVDYLNINLKTGIFQLLLAPLSLSLGFPLLILAGLGLFVPPSTGNQTRFPLFCCCFFFLTLLFFAGGAGEKGELTLNSSFLRNMMPALALLPLLAVRAISRLDFPSSPCLVILAAFNLLIALLGPSSIADAVIRSGNYGEYRQFLLRELDPGAVLFSAYWDKLVFPERTVYARGDRRTEEELNPVVAEAYRRGREIVTTSHPRDRKVLSCLRKDYQLGEIPGPEKITLPPPDREGERLKLYKVTGKKAEETGEKPFLPTITRFPEEPNY